MSFSHLSCSSHFTSPFFLFFFIPTSVFPPSSSNSPLSPRRCPQRLTQCTSIRTLMPKLMGRRRGRNDLHRTADGELRGGADALGLHRKEIGSGGNESRLCDVIYYNPSGERGGGVSLITGSSEHIRAAVQHDNRLQEPLKNSSTVFIFFYLYVGGCKLAEQRSVWAWSTASAANLHWRRLIKTQDSVHMLSASVLVLHFSCVTASYFRLFIISSVSTPLYPSSRGSGGGVRPTRRRRLITAASSPLLL